MVILPFITKEKNAYEENDPLIFSQHCLDGLL